MFQNLRIGLIKKIIFFTGNEKLKQGKKQFGTFQRGLKQEFDLGIRLRNIYGDWLGDYDRDLVSRPARKRMVLELETGIGFIVM